MKIKIKKLNENAVLPTCGSEYSAGYDLYAAGSYVIKPHDTQLISTAIAVEIPEGYFGAIYARSGLATKEGIRPANCVAVIDADYRGEIKIPLHNDGIKPTHYIVSKGERVAQLVIQPFLKIDWEEVEELSETSRESGGFGSTGK